MGAAKIPGRKNAIAIGVVMLALALFGMLNQLGGPVVEATGIVQSFAFLPSDVGAPPQTATVRLTEGATVQATILSGVLVQPGQVVRVRVYRRVITGAPSYELIGTESRK
jgi:hypothetical protein